jgi:hypothetical protein
VLTVRPADPRCRQALPLSLLQIEKIDIQTYSK